MSSSPTAAVRKSPDVVAPAVQVHYHAVVEAGSLKGLTGLKSRGWQGRFLPEAPKEDPFLGLFQILEEPTFLGL